MKKFACMIFALIICFCSLSGCTPEGGKQTRNVVELTDFNFANYLVVHYIKDFVPTGDDTNLEVEIEGVLDYAYYEDVVLTFEVTLYVPGQTSKPTTHEVYVTLNAAGDAQFRVEYSGLPLISNGVGQEIDYNGISELVRWHRTIRLKSVTGKVIYTI